MYTIFITIFIKILVKTIYSINKKYSLSFLLFVIFIFSSNVSASAIIGPSCFVNAKIIQVGSDKTQSDSGSEYTTNYFKLEIISVDARKDCPVKQGQIFKAIDNNPSTFQKGDVINAGIEAGSSMGPSGAVSFLQWSEISYENGDKIYSNYNNSIINSFQSDPKPISIDTYIEEQEENKEKVNSSNISNTIYYYITITALVVVGFFIYYFYVNKKQSR